MSVWKEKLYKARHEKNGIQRWLARNYLFRIAERCGFHILGDHFYEPIPNLENIRKSYDESPREIPGHPIRLGDFESPHAARLQKYGPEFEGAVKPMGYDPGNHYFRGGDAISYYAWLREVKPPCVVEVGQGMSTRVALAALERNAAEGAPSPRFISIDPYVRVLPEDLAVKHVEFQLINKPIQEVPVEEVMANCGPESLLFVDSSHVYKYGSDVWHLTHKLYPLLPVGTYLHVHDVVLPYPWPADFYLKQKWFWNEQEMLEAFLSFNNAFEIVLPVYWLHRNSSRVREIMDTFAPDLPAKDTGFSFYMKRV